jgi:hypothetical protein
MLSRIKGKLNAWRKRDAPHRTAFVIACPRSGTTWLKEMLNAHPEILCTENRLFGRHFDVVESDRGEPPRLRITMDHYVDGFLQHFEWGKLGLSREDARDAVTTKMLRVLEEIIHENSGLRIVVDKITPYPETAGTVIEALVRYYPEANVLRLIRDGRDVLTSGVFHWMRKSLRGKAAEEHSEKRRRILLQNDSSASLSRFFLDEEIEEWVGLWTQPLMATGQSPGQLKMMDLRYESLKGDTAGSLGEVFDCLKARNDAGCRRACVEAGAFERMSGGRHAGDAVPDAHVRKGVVGDWRNYFTRRDGALFWQLAGDWMRELGYASDGDWVNSLPEEWTPAPARGRRGKDGGRSAHGRACGLHP